MSNNQVNQSWGIHFGELPCIIRFHFNVFLYLMWKKNNLPHRAMESWSGIFIRILLEILCLVLTCFGRFLVDDNRFITLKFYSLLQWELFGCSFLCSILSKLRNDNVVSFFKYLLCVLIGRVRVKDKRV